MNQLIRGVLVTGLVGLFALLTSGILPAQEGVPSWDKSDPLA